LPFFFGERSGSTVVISGRDALHLARSLRARPGETISVVEPGRLLSVRLVSVRASEVVGEVVDSVEREVEPRLSVTVALAMLPAAALEEALARCTELGAAAFVLFRAERSVGRAAAKAERWASICREASMLAGRERVPSVVGPVDDLPDGLMLDASGGERLASLSFAGSVTLLVGPEGGWTDSERSGRRLVSLGPRNLRAENAAAAALAVALAAAGDL
jgi:16S rRNA (uracil1498-N3)-methyltransferase